jgi:hypothetical protein
MRAIQPLLFTIACLSAIHAARAQEVLYRCETADGISIQGVPCPKGASQRKIAVPKLAPAATRPPSVDTVSPIPATPPVPPAATAAATASTTTPPPPKPGIHWVPVTDDALLHGPNDPYPLWQCMRGDGSTYDRRDGKASKQWVPTLKPSEDESTPETAPTPAQASALPKRPITRPIEQKVYVADDSRPPDLGHLLARGAAPADLRGPAQRARRVRARGTGPDPNAVHRLRAVRTAAAGCRAFTQLNDGEHAAAARCCHRPNRRRIDACPCPSAAACVPQRCSSRRWP